jgi:hypothetical protein
MARTNLTPQNAASSGLAASYAAGDNTNGMQFAYHPRRVLHVKNTTGAPINVTVPIPATVDGKAVASQVVAVPATNGERFIGPFPSAYQQADGNVYVDFAATGTTVALLELPVVS